MPQLQEARRVWTTQPPPNVGLSRTGWRSRIIAAIDARGALASRPVQRVGTPVTSQRAIGATLVGNNASLITEQFPGVAFPFTQLVVMANIARTANGNVSAGPGDNSGNQWAGFQFSSGSGVDNRFLLRATNSASGDSSYRAFSANATTASAQNIVLGANVVSNSSIDVYWNGVLDNGTFGSSGGGPSSGSPTWGRLAIGGIDRGTDIYADTGNDSVIVVLVQGVLSSAEHLEFARNWYSVYDEEDELVYFSAGGGTDYPVTQTEAATGSDTTSCLIGYAPAATEAGSASDAASAAMAAVVAIIEAASATSSEAAVTARQAAITEAATATDTTNGTASGDYTATITEAATASSLEAAVSNYLAAISESASASDSASASLPGEYSVSISEAASAIETAVCAMSALVTINEAAAAADVANWVGAITFTRAPRGSGYPGTKPTTTRGGQTNTTRPTMANTRR